MLARATRHPGTPWHATAVILVVVGYAVSPIDLIPDFIPVFGYLDDLVLVPLGIALARRLVPDDVLEQCRADSTEVKLTAAGIVAALVIVAAWMVAAWLLWSWGARRW